MKKISFISILFFACLNNQASSQHILKAIVQDSISGEKLFGVNVILANTTNGGSSNVDGVLEIKDIPDGEQIFSVTSIGYRSKTLQLSFPLASPEPVLIKLSREQSELEEVIVTTTRTNSRIEEAPIKVEVLGLEEMNEENSIKPGNVSSILGDISSVQIQPTSPVTANAVVRMQGLDGKYTLLLRDGIPAYGGLSGGLNILQIPPLDLKQIEIIKGPASTLDGGGAIAGLINFISKEPADSGEASFTLNQSTLGETDLNAYLSGKKNRMGYTLLGSYINQLPVDVDKDEFSDVPLLHSFLLHPQFFYHFDSHSKLKIAFTTSLEDRTGGEMQAVKGNIDSLHQYFDNIRTARNNVDLVFTNISSKKNEFSVKASLNQFDRRETTNQSAFIGEQWNGYAELFYSLQLKKHNIIFGSNYILDAFKEFSNDLIQIPDYTYHTGGLFAQYSFNLEKRINLQAGLRTDYHSEFGWFVLPSAAVLVHAGKNFSFRINGGTGYKTPNLLEIMESSITGGGTSFSFSSNMEAEESTGGTGEWNFKKIFSNDASLFINQTFFFTRVTSAILPVPVTDGFAYRNIFGTITSKGIDNYIRFTLHPYEVYVGYTYTLPENSANTQPYLTYTPLHRGAVTIVDEFTEHWRMGIEASYNGFQYKEDGSKTRDYFFLASSLQYKTGKFTFVLNGENLLDFRQTNFERVVLPPGNDPVFVPLWAPVDGRVINLSVMVKL